MRAITAVGATPNRLAILYDLLADTGPAGLERSKIQALITPPTLANEPEPGTDNALSDCLNAGEDLGIFVTEAGVVRLNVSSSAAFLELAENLMINAPASVGPSEGWMAGAVGWMLCQDPRRPLQYGQSGARNRLRQDFGAEGPEFGMTNDSRWQQAVYWARALGYVERSPSPEEGVIPDPTRAIERRLTRILPLDVKLPLPAVLADLAVDCPVIDGGRLRIEVERLSGVRLEQGQLSGSLSLAFVRLERRGFLLFDALSDAPPVFVDGVDGGRASHVTRKAPGR